LEEEVKRKKVIWGGGEGAKGEKCNKSIFGGWLRPTSEPAAEAAALVGPAAVAAPAAQGEVALALRPDVTRHLFFEGKRHESRAFISGTGNTPLGEGTIHSHFNLLAANCL